MADAVAHTSVVKSELLIVAEGPKAAVELEAQRALSCSIELQFEGHSGEAQPQRRAAVFRVGRHRLDFRSVRWTQHRSFDFYLST